MESHRRGLQGAPVWQRMGARLSAAKKTLPVLSLRLTRNAPQGFC